MQTHLSNGALGYREQQQRFQIVYAKTSVECCLGPQRATTMVPEARLYNEGVPDRVTEANGSNNSVWRQAGSSSTTRGYSWDRNSEAISEVPLTSH